MHAELAFFLGLFPLWGLETEPESWEEQGLPGPGC